MLLECKNTAFGYEGMTVVSDLNFTVNEGDYLTIVGENGSGKSTLIKGILKLKTPSDGLITENFKSNEIGYLPQQTQIQKDFPASCYEVVISGCLGDKRGFPFYDAADKKTALLNMERLGITNLIHACYRELSGGQQQRVLLARALCSAKKLLLLDEPAAGLDPLITNELYSLIKNLNKEKLTIIMVSHDINAAAKYSSHILHLRNKQIFFGKINDYILSDICKIFIT